MSIVSSMNIATQALATNQAAITVVSNNIANVDTEGYSKLRANQATVVNSYQLVNDSAILKANALSGVTLESITRYSNMFMQESYWEENSTYSYLEQYSSVAANIEDLVNELNDTGLSDALETFYTAVNALNNTPSDITARTNYVSASQNVCAVFNNMYKSVNDIQASLVGTVSFTDDSEIQTQVDSVNDILGQLAKVNENIIRTTTDATPSSSLLDLRDSLVSQLSEFIPVNTTENKNGTIDVKLGNYNLLNGASVSGKLDVQNTGIDADGHLITNISIINPENSRTVVSNVNDLIDDGSIGAVLDVCGSDIDKLTVNSVLDNLNNMANAFAQVMNSIQTQTNYPSGTNTPMCLTNDGSQLQVSGPTNYLFVNKDSAVLSASGITASNISVNSALISDPYLVAAARVTDPAITTAIGNNSNVELITAARTNASYYAGTPIAGSTLEGSLTTMVSNVGAKVKDVDTNLKTQTAVLGQVEQNLQSSIGVNLDEELTDMIKYQRAYQAAARVFSICSELLDDLVNLGR